MNAAGDNNGTQRTLVLDVGTSNSFFNPLSAGVTDSRTDGQT